MVYEIKKQNPELEIIINGGISKINEIIKQYYEDTKSSDLYQIEYEFYLLKNDYKGLHRGRRVY